MAGSAYWCEDGACQGVPSQSSSLLMWSGKSCKQGKWRTHHLYTDANILIPIMSIDFNTYVLCYTIAFMYNSCFYENIVIETSHVNWSVPRVEVQPVVGWFTSPDWHTEWVRNASPDTVTHRMREGKLLINYSVFGRWGFVIFILKVMGSDVVCLLTHCNLWQCN